jgi:hypothetical protein
LDIVVEAGLAADKREKSEGSGNPINDAAFASP